MTPHRVPLRAILLATAGALGLVVPAFAHGETMPAPELPGVLLAWRFDLLPLAGVAVASVAYLWAVRQVARRHRSNPPPRWRTGRLPGWHGRARGGAVLADRGVRGAAVQRPHGAAHAAGAGGRAADPAGRADDPDAARRLAGRAPRAAGRAAQPRRGGADLPAADLAALRRGELGLAFQHALQPGTGERAPSLLPACDLPDRRAAVLVAGGRSRSRPMAPPLPGPPLLPLPGHAAELVPGRGADERAGGAVPALPDHAAAVGSQPDRRPEPGRDPHVDLR